MAGTRMVTSDEASRRARVRFDRTAPAWAASAFLRLSEAGPGDDGQAAPAAYEGLPFSIPLHPPTEREALADIAGARAWVETWRVCDNADLVEWGSRQWPSVGTQTVPERLTMRTPEDAARVADCLAIWETMLERAADTAMHWRSSWQASHPDAAASQVAGAVSTTARGGAALPSADWNILLAVIDWLAAHPRETPYARQLPIRGIGTKWVEQHRALLKPFSRALNGTDPAFAQPPRCIRVRMLDRAIAPGGIVDLALPVHELDRVVRAARLAIICENLVSTLTLPDMPGAIAIHGGGYAVGDLRAVTALADMHLLYWGDLDTNGFAILNDLRNVFPHAVSAMMDEVTLERYLDLCVEEPKPNTGRFPNLTPEENATLVTLRQGDPARNISTLRLEQERIEWTWACSKILEAAN